MFAGKQFHFRFSLQSLSVFRFWFPYISTVHCCVIVKFRSWVDKSQLWVQRTQVGGMFSWGEDSQRGFRLKHGALTDSHRHDGDDDDDDGEDDGGGVQYADLGYHIRDLSAGHSVLAFCKSNGNSFIIRTNESKDGRRVRGKQSERHHTFLLRFIYVR